MKVFSRALFSFALAGSLSGCAAANHQIDANEELRTHLAAQFETGKIDFTCVAACSGAWGFNRRYARRYLILEQWDNLSKLVLRIGYNSDLSWYYLGRAAEGKGYDLAATKYYARVLAISQYGSLIGHRCDGLFNNCDGFKFPDDAIDRLKLMAPNSIQVEASIRSPHQL